MRRRRRPGHSRRASWDVTAIREAISGPGVDTRTWVANARVDDDDDAIRWDSQLGFIVNVTIQGGPLDQVGPIACRFGNPYVADGGQRSDPPTKGMLVVITLHSGNPNVACTIVGCLPSPDFAVPQSVNGQTIDEAFAEATHVLVTEHSVQQQVGEKWRTEATSRATLAAPEVRLASEDADQSFVRGDDRKNADDDFLTALNTFVPLVQAGIVAAGGSLDTTAMLQAIEQYRTAIANALSTKIKGQ